MLKTTWRSWWGAVDAVTNRWSRFEIVTVMNGQSHILCKQLHHHNLLPHKCPALRHTFSVDPEILVVKGMVWWYLQVTTKTVQAFTFLKCEKPTARVSAWHSLAHSRPCDIMFSSWSMLKERGSRVCKKKKKGKDLATWKFWWGGRQCYVTLKIM